MHSVKSFASALGLVALSSIAACRAERPHTIDDVALRDADADSADWLSYGRTYSEQRHSPLRQVDEASVARLGLAWSVDMQTLRGLEGTPLVSDGVMFATSAWSVVYAIDAKNGAVLWRYDPAVPKDHAKFVCCDVVNRGVALYGDKVYVGTIDGRLVALDRKTGAPVWTVQTTPKDGPYAITGAPRIAGGRVVIGNAGSEYAVRGFVSAYDVGTGALAWKTYMVPGDPSKPFEQEALRRAATTWSGQWYKAGGGASPWDPIVYDPALDLIYVGTANANPWYPELRGDKEGDNLFASSIVALRAGTGEIVWHYQTTPGDSWDYDATQPITLAELVIDGTTRKVLMQPNKNAFFYVIDRENGKLLSATPYASMTWATGIDSSGRPIVNPAAKPTRTGVLVSPADYGGHNWNPTSFSPTTKLLYFGVTDGGVLLHVVDSNFTLNANDRTMGYDARYDGPLRAKWLAEPAAKGRLVAWDPVAKREAWRVDFPGLRSGGTLSTAGNIIFQGRGDGVFAAYRATDGKLLWHYDAQVGIAAAPMTYAVGGVQYVAILVAPPQLYTDPKIHTGPGRLLVFALDGKATLAPIVRAESPIAAPTFTVKATPAEIVEGRGLYSMYCRRCHNPDFNLVKSGAIPDLRRANEATHATFEQIVRGGARRTLGMPSFAKDISSDQVRLIQAYVLDQARQAAAPSTATPTAASATAPPPVFQRIKLEQSGDAGVHTYRIPALAVANDGTLIAAFDARNDSKGDLPGNIDVMVRRSRDLGRSWSAARRVVDFDAGRGGGDASLLVDRTTGRVFLFYVYAPAGMGIFKSNTDRDSASTGTVHPQVIWSDDHGASWKGPRDLTAQLKPSGATGMFATSGHGIQLSARSAAPGRLLQPYAWLDGERRMHAANAYSDDHGATWRLGASIGTGLDENKVVELSDGRVMQNIRSYAKEVSHRLVAISHDGGVHFDSATVDRQLPDPRNNADIVRVAPDAAPATREAQMLLFSNTADEAHRRNLTVRLSCDSGRSWPVSKVVEPGLAMYSVMARLRDGTFGLLYENGEDEGLTFARFDLAWLGGGC